MSFELLPTLPDALRILSDATGTKWTREAFFTAVIELALPLRSTTPEDCQPIIESMGKQYDAGLPILGYRRHALLSLQAIKNLAIHGEAQSVDVALEPGDPGFMPWPAIKAHRLVLDLEFKQKPRPLNADDWHEHQATYMGESDGVVLSQWVKITDASCRVPAETIEELRIVYSSKVNKPNTGKTAGVTATRHRIRINSLDAPIQMAISAASTMASSEVWVYLKELALQGKPPFTGHVEGSKLFYTTDDNKVGALTKDAVKKRLERLRRVANG